MNRNEVISPEDKILQGDLCPLINKVMIEEKEKLYKKILEDLQKIGVIKC